MIIREMHEARKRSIESRLRRAVRFNPPREPVLSASNIRYEASEKTRAINVGGIGLIHKQQFPVASEVFCFSVKNAAITAGVS